MPSRSYPPAGPSAPKKIYPQKNAPPGHFRQDPSAFPKKGSPAKKASFPRKSAMGRVAPQHNANVSARQTPAHQSKSLATELEEMRDTFADLTQSHHKVVRNAIVRRYRKCLECIDDPHSMDELCKLAGHKLKENQVLGFVFKRTIPDERKASKYKCRVLKLWLDRASPDAVLDFLEREGLQPKPKKKATEKPRQPATGKGRVTPGKDYIGPKAAGTKLKIIAEITGGRRGVLDVKILQTTAVT